MKVRTVVIAESIFLSLVFFLANIRSSIFWSMYPPTEAITDPAWREILLWLLALGLMFYLLSKKVLLEVYLQNWRQQPFLIGFVIFSLASTIWSNTWTVTLHRSLAFACVTAAAVYLGVRYSINNFTRVLVALGAVILISSYALIYISPTLGTDLNPPYNGAWRGIFWHKNQLGNILPIFTLASMVCFFSPELHNRVSDKINAVLLYVFSLVAIFFTNSASGYILIIIIHFTFGLAYLWLKLRHLIRPVHYYIILAVLLAGGVGVLLNLEFVLGIFNRNPTFTGRVPLWGLLLRDVFPQNSWIGRGFGTIWADLDFRLQMSHLMDWRYPIMIGDNGFLDILLNLGIVGFGLFLLNYIKAWGNSISFFQRGLSLESIFPFIFMIYTFFANLTFSLFMETEVFVWMLIVSLMVISSQTHPQYNQKERTII